MNLAEMRETDRNMETASQSQNPRLGVIEASSGAEARTFEERSNKKRFYPDGADC